MNNSSKIDARIASFYLILMCVQLIWIEGWGISYVKVGAMAIAPIITIARIPRITKATLWCGLYFMATLFSAVVLHENYRVSTLVFSLLFLMMFNMYYGLVYKGAFTIDFYIKLVKGLIYAYIICLVAQQLTSIAGFAVVPVLNKTYVLFGRGILSGNSLAIEPSHAARIMGFAFYAFLKVSEIKKGEPLSFRQIFIENKWLTFGFLWIMVTMGSGTAFVVLGILSFYFIKKKYILFIVPIIVIAYITIPMIDNYSLNRARIAVDIAITGDTEEIKNTDSSAAVRINPMLNTIRNLDLTSFEQWFGHGTDTAKELGVFSGQRQVGIINDYGLLVFIIGVFLIYSCCITRFFSLETLLIALLLSFFAANIAYVWGCYMLLVPVKYFYNHYKRQYNE